ncbi:MAG: hypothetical protein IJI84_02590 [Clostridia bacterium]|nr:hypothetical protein [Clostridia bacterium]
MCYNKIEMKHLEMIDIIELTFLNNHDSYILKEDGKKGIGSETFTGKELANWVNNYVDNVYEKGAVTFKENGGFSIKGNVKIERPVRNIWNPFSGKDLDKQTIENPKFFKCEILSLKKILYNFFKYHLGEKLSADKLKFLLIRNGFAKFIVPYRDIYNDDDGYELWRPALIPDLVENIEDDLLKYENSKKTRSYKCENDMEFYIALANEVVLHNLKPNFCVHCGGLFFTSTLKQKYCHRKSKVKNYTHLDCNKAVRDIKQQLRRKKKQIYNRLYNYWEQNDIDKFLNEVNPYFDKIKVVPSIKNLNLCFYVCGKWDELTKKKDKK